MGNRARYLLLPWVAAVLVVALAAALTLFLQPIAQVSSPLFFGAILVATWYGGLWPGVLATALSTIALDYFFPPPISTVSIAVTVVARLGVFGLVWLLIGSLYAAGRRTEESSARALARARRARAKTRAADRHKDRFLAILAHELRSPLSTIRNTLGVFRNQNLDAGTLRWGQEVLERQMKFICRLVDGLLDVSAIRCGKIQLKRESVDLTSLLKGIVEDQRRAVEDANLSLRTEWASGPLWVFGDPLRLVQVVNNLVVNACKFTDPGGVVSIRLIAKDDRWAALTVRDTGIGIDAGMLPHVFDVFWQAERSGSPSRGGLGLGLALVKGLVELHEGQLTVASEGLGRGAEFNVLLPLQPEPRRHAEEEIDVGPNSEFGTWRIELRSGNGHLDADAVGEAAMEHSERTLSEALRQQVFQMLVEQEDRAIPAAQSRRVVAERFGISEDQLDGIESEGVENGWSPP
jgi:signal transduction histidine kinase